MRNKQIDLDNHLFAELERLGDESLSEEELEVEIKRADAMAKVAATINDSRALEVKVAKLRSDVGSDKPVDAVASYMIAGASDGR